MNATAAHRPPSPLDETIPRRGDEASSASRPPAGRFAFGCGDRPLEGYAIKRAVGRGGFGEVYYAVSDAGREVALKLILRNLEVERRGVAHCMNLKHPNLLSIFDLKTNDEGDSFVVMEYVAGSSLADALRANPAGLPLDEVRHWLKGLAEGVAYLHDHGVVHRDLKPANLFMEEGVVKIGDYGLAKLIASSRGGDHSESIGTCQYMAPEIGSGKYGRAIDVYAVGVILYEMLVGRVPFDGETVNEILMKHLTARPDVSVLPEPYRAVVARALAKDPNQRPARVHDLLAPADAPATPEIRVIGAKGVGEAAATTDAEEVHRIEAEEPVFYIGPDTMPPRPSFRERAKADWRRMRDRGASRRPAPPGPPPGFVRAVPDAGGYAPPRGARRGETPPPPPERPTGRARVAEVTASMLWAALLVGLLMAPAVGLLGLDPARDAATIVFLYGVALLTTWTALVLGKFQEARGTGRGRRRVAAAVAGAGVGGSVWLLGEGLWIDGPELLPAVLSFALLFALTTAWHGQAARDRKRRFRLIPVAWTLLVAALLLPWFRSFGGPESAIPEGIAVAGIVVATVQIVSPWDEKAARYAKYVRKLGKTRAA